MVLLGKFEEEPKAAAVETDLIAAMAQPEVKRRGRPPKAKEMPLPANLE